MVINAYGPVEDTKAEEKAKFCEKLEEMCEEEIRIMVVMIMGDFNVKVIREDLFRDVAARKTLHERTCSLRAHRREY